MFNLYMLSEILHKDIKDIVFWCQIKGLVPNSKQCSVCLSEMFLNTRNNAAFWRCQRQEPHKHDIQKSVFENTLFYKSNFGIKSILIFIYKFANGETSYEAIKRETSIFDVKTSDRTICKWLKHCREICYMWMDDRFDIQGKIGGIGKTVEIDETKVGKRKYQRGRLVEGQWVLGIIEIVDNEKCRGGNFRLAVCPNNKRDSETLLSIIQKNVEPGTTVVTDLWRGYSCLDSNGYKHLTVNHKLNFIDPKTYANTQTIESNWRALKRTLGRGGIPKENVTFHMFEYLWRRELKRQNKDYFLGFLETISDLHK